jgi:4-hydroxy-tetrahydrodipicolinate synthase
MHKSSIIKYMKNHVNLAGIFAASITPLQSDGSPDLDGIEQMVYFLAGRGCHGLLLLGTTGEGASFSPSERALVFKAAIEARKGFPDLHLLGGTGTPSLDETVELTRLAFDLGFEGVVVLPPYYYKKVTDDGLFAWFDTLLRQAVPTDGSLLGYHIPQVTGLGFSLDLLSRIKDAHPSSFAGIKDSSGDPTFAKSLGERFGHDLHVLTGNDRLFSLALESQASGCITAMANLVSPLLRKVWEAFLAGQPDPSLQDTLTKTRLIFDRYPPMPPLLKALLHHVHNLPLWPVKPPLIPMPPTQVSLILEEISNLSSQDY